MSKLIWFASSAAAVMPAVSGGNHPRRWSWFTRPLDAQVKLLQARVREQRIEQLSKEKERLQLVHAIKASTASSPPPTLGRRAKSPRRDCHDFVAGAPRLD